MYHVCFQNLGTPPGDLGTSPRDQGYFQRPMGTFRDHKGHLRDRGISRDIGGHSEGQGTLRRPTDISRNLGAPPETQRHFTQRPRAALEDLGAPPET